ncbi:hypothetical protein TIFTF001_007924 [Ficus carica]|uniref:Uncharacterized protein n=1 Tax=Ficus carica TaxID=3494 RepID=A0AA88A7J7_FICCA|nr:hypothetical protein TIFTF001_051082 [Ficus carica]GMN38686.1 hypothetical protein TIFTF001_007924 [Ficus carica]
MDKSALLLVWSTRVVGTKSQPSAHTNLTTLEPRREHQLRNGSQTVKPSISYDATRPGLPLEMWFE